MEAAPAMGQRKACLDAPTYRATSPPLPPAGGPGARAMQTTDDPKVPWGWSQISVAHTLPAHLSGGSKRSPARFPKKEGYSYPLALGRGPTRAWVTSTPQWILAGLQCSICTHPGCHALYLSSVSVETLSGALAVQKAISTTLERDVLPTPTVVHFKVTKQGITLTDIQRK